MKKLTFKLKLDSEQTEYLLPGLPDGLCVGGLLKYWNLKLDDLPSTVYITLSDLPGPSSYAVRFSERFVMFGGQRSSYLLAAVRDLLRAKGIELNTIYYVTLWEAT